MKPNSLPVDNWLNSYKERQILAIDSIPLDRVASLIERLNQMASEGRQVFVFGNGGSACNASHFATDLGKGSSDKFGKRFKCISLNDNTGWLTALGNDYDFEDVFVRQLMNYAQPGDLVLALSVSGSSPNLVKALDWASCHGVHSVALVGARRGRLAEKASEVIVVDSEHYGRTEDVHMTVCHMICYAFMESVVAP